jgi:hypothetical protein
MVHFSKNYPSHPAGTIATRTRQRGAIRCKKTDITATAPLPCTRKFNRCFYRLTPYLASNIMSQILCNFEKKLCKISKLFSTHLQPLPVTFAPTAHIFPPLQPFGSESELYFPFHRSLHCCHFPCPRQPVRK